MHSSSFQNTAPDFETTIKTADQAAANSSDSAVSQTSANSSDSAASQTAANSSDSHEPLNLEQLLADGMIVRIHPIGYSMYPMFVPGRDEALLEQTSAELCRKNDVVLYRRRNGMLVLHRICRITPEGIYTVGDNQSVTEGPLAADQIIGVLTAFIRNGKEYSIRQPFYRFLSALWLFLLPVRPLCFRFTAALRKLHLF